jgi:uncharacterized membrane protein
MTLFAQATPTDVEMADNFRAEGKIYVLVAIMLTILIGLVIYLIRIDRKVSKLEKELPPKQ